MRLNYKVIAVIIACAVLLLGSNMIAAQEDEPPRPPESAVQQSPDLDAQEASVESTEGGEGYQAGGRRIGTPTDVDRDLDFSFPKRDYVLPRLVPPRYFQWKEDLYQKYGVKLGFS